jgi:hypothetical protein
MDVCAGRGECVGHTECVLERVEVKAARLDEAAVIAIGFEPIPQGFFG